MFRWLRRRPVYGPPFPNIECGERHWCRFWWCDLRFGHDGDHGHIIGTSRRTGGLVESTSVTREMWSR